MKLTDITTEKLIQWAEENNLKLVSNAWTTKTIGLHEPCACALSTAAIGTGKMDFNSLYYFGQELKSIADAFGWTVEEVGSFTRGFDDEIELNSDGEYYARGKLLRDELIEKGMLL